MNDEDAGTVVMPRQNDQSCSLMGNDNTKQDQNWSISSMKGHESIRSIRKNEKVIIINEFHGNLTL